VIYLGVEMIKSDADEGNSRDLLRKKDSLFNIPDYVWMHERLWLFIN